MIVTAPDSPSERATHWVLFTQTDHAGLAADILGLMPRLADHPLRDELLRATREHDNGWAESDSAPRVDAQGLPCDFRSMPSLARLDLWQRGVQRHLTADPPVALLILRHALRLHRGDADPPWAEALRSWTALEYELRQDLLLDEELVDETYRHLELADSISLAACGALDQASVAGARITRLPRSEVEDPELFAAVRLEPFPLAGSTTFRISGRRIPRRPYSDTVDLGSATATARWERFRITLTA